jgi:hypothetical protein
MKNLTIRILVMSVIAFGVCVSLPDARSQGNPRPAMASEMDFRRAMKELSNWGRWGADDEHSPTISSRKQQRMRRTSWSACWVR